MRERKRLSAALKSIPDEESRILLTTGRYIGEGFDDARLDTLFPGAARLLARHHPAVRRSPAPTPREQAHSSNLRHVDAGVPMLLAMRNKRLKGYRDIGYTIVEEVSLEPVL